MDDGEDLSAESAIAPSRRDPRRATLGGGGTGGSSPAAVRTMSENFGSIPQTPIPVVETERLVLRGFVGEDLDAFAAISADPQTMQYVGGVRSREDVWNAIAVISGHWALRGFGMWAVDEKETGRLVGRIGLYHPEGWPGIEVGWVLARDVWGRGYATEGAKASVRYAYDAVRVDRLITIIDPRNERSIRVAERLGASFSEQITLRGTVVNVYDVPPLPGPTTS